MGVRRSVRNQWSIWFLNSGRIEWLSMLGKFAAAVGCSVKSLF
jgi:hypothetical protein